VVRPYLTISNGGGDIGGGGEDSLTERSEVENLDTIRFEANDVLVELSLALSAIMTGKARDFTDPDELYHQLQDLLGMMVELASDDSALVQLLEDRF